MLPEDTCIQLVHYQLVQLNGGTRFYVCTFLHECTLVISEKGIWMLSTRKKLECLSFIDHPTVEAEVHAVS